MASVKCDGIQVGLALDVRVGTCTDEAGNKYLDLGAGIGPNGGLYVFSDKAAVDRDSFNVEGRLYGGLVKAGSLSTLQNERGWGLGLGATVGVRGLVPLSSGVKTRPSN